MGSVIIGSRLQFSDAFEYANVNLKGEIVIVANADIYFDSTLNELVDSRLDIDFRGHVLALLKWKKHFGSISINLRTDSQDAWIFQPPLHSSVINKVKFNVGAARCDNRLAKILDEHGHRPINPYEIRDNMTQKIRCFLEKV